MKLFHNLYKHNQSTNLTGVNLLWITFFLIICTEWTVNNAVFGAWSLAVCAKKQHPYTRFHELFSQHYRFKKWTHDNSLNATLKRLWLHYLIYIGVLPARHRPLVTVLNFSVPREKEFCISCTMNWKRTPFFCKKLL